MKLFVNNPGNLIPLETPSPRHRGRKEGRKCKRKKGRRRLPGKVTIEGLPSISEVILVGATISETIEALSHDGRALRGRIIQRIPRIHHPSSFVQITSFFQSLLHLQMPNTAALHSVRRNQTRKNAQK